MASMTKNATTHTEVDEPLEMVAKILPNINRSTYNGWIKEGVRSTKLPPCAWAAIGPANALGLRNSSKRSISERDGKPSEGGSRIFFTFMRDPP